MRRLCVSVLIVSCILVSALGGGASRAEADETEPTNFELVRDAARAASQELVAKLPSERRGPPLVVRSVGGHEGAFLAENALSGVLAEAGFDVRTREDSTGVVLEFEVVDLGMTYTRTWRHAWLGERRVEREARARLFARLLDQDSGIILWGEQAEAKVLDDIATSDLSAVEEKGGAEYLKSAVPPQGWNKFVEPVVVTGIVVGLIVLFFANQDTSN